MIVFSGIMTFVLLKIVGIFLPLRLSDEELEIGDHAIHGNEVYPSDVPTLGGPHARLGSRADGAVQRLEPELGRAAQPPGAGMPPDLLNPRLSGPASAGSRPLMGTGRIVVPGQDQNPAHRASCYARERPPVPEG